MTESDPWDVARNLASIERQWSGLRALCGDDSAFRAKAEAVSAWDVGQHTKHCAIVMSRIVRAIELMLANPQQGVGLGPTVDRAIPMLVSGDIPRGMGKAAAFLIPEPGPDRAETRTMVESAAKLWQGLSARCSELQECQATFAHFALGNFTTAQWVRFMAVHTAHHFKIVRDILGAAGIKTPYDAKLESV